MKASPSVTFWKPENGVAREVHRILPGQHQQAGQERTGHRGAAQAVATYLNGGNWRIIAEFTEIESGRRSDRPALEKALAAARVRQVPLVVAKADRLTRSVAFLSRLLEAGDDVRFADLPMIEAATGNSSFSKWQQWPNWRPG